MLKTVNAVEGIEKLFMDGNFELENWNKYMDSLLPNHKNLFLYDMNQDISAGGYTLENNCFPILNSVLLKKEKRIEAIKSFAQVTENLEKK